MNLCLHKWSSPEIESHMNGTVYRRSVCEKCGKERVSKTEPEWPNQYTKPQCPSDDSILVDAAVSVDPKIRKMMCPKCARHYDVAVIGGSIPPPPPLPEHQKAKPIPEPTVTLGGLFGTKTLDPGKPPCKHQWLETTTHSDSTQTFVCSRCGAKSGHGATVVMKPPTALPGGGPPKPSAVDALKQFAEVARTTGLSMAEVTRAFESISRAMEPKAAAAAMDDMIAAMRVSEPEPVVPVDVVRRVTLPDE